MIFSKTKKEKPKRKVSRVIMKSMTISLAALIALSGLSGFNKAEVKSEASNDTTTYTYQSFTSKVPDEYVEGSLEGEPIGLSELEYAEFMQYVSEIETEYLDSDLYGYDEAMVEYPIIEEVMEHSKSILDENGEFNVDKLFETVKKNNAEYLPTLSDTKRVFIEELEDSEIKDLCKKVVETVNYRLAQNQELDKNELSCKIANLKMLGKPGSPSVAAADWDGCLYFNKNATALLEIGWNGEESREGSIIHEINHIIQAPCIDKKLSGNSLEAGICWGKNFDESKIEDAPNPFYWNWFIEASAEESMKEQMRLNTTPLYSSQTSYLNSLKLATILNPNVETNQMESVCFNNNPEAFYSMFNRESYNREIVNLMYAIEITQGYNNLSIEDAYPAGFFKAYKEKYGEELSDDIGNLPEYKFALKVPICETLSKIFYENLAKSVLNGNTTKEDVFYLIKVFEADLIGHLATDENKREDIYEFQKEFYASYTAIQEQFFSALGFSNNSTLEQIKADFDSYSMRIKNGTETKEHNCDLAFLSSTSKDYVVDREKELYSSTRPGISEFYYKHQNNGLNLY